MRCAGFDGCLLYAGGDVGLLYAGELVRMSTAGHYVGSSNVCAPLVNAGCMWSIRCSDALVIAGGGPFRGVLFM